MSFTVLVAYELPPTMTAPEPYGKNTIFTTTASFDTIDDVLDYIRLDLKKDPFKLITIMHEPEEEHP